MHNIDRTQPELSEEYEGFELGGQSEEFGALGELGESFEYEGGEYEEVASPFAEHEEYELAAELLEIQSEEELNYFLGKLFKRVGSVAGRLIRSPVGRALGGVLRNVAKTALPMAGAALGNLVLPGVGGAIGGKLGSAAGRIFGLELEGMSAEDREFEVARRYVRLAGAAARRAAMAAPSLPPQRAAYAALQQAARTYAPGLLAAGGVVGGGLGAGVPSVTSSFGARTGRWIRRGRRIIVLGV